MTFNGHIIYDIQTGETTEIPLTAEEIELSLAEKQRVHAETTEREAQTTTKAAEKAALLAKLGITAEQAKLLLS